MVDYSKWDKIDYGSDDDLGGSVPPKVTRVENSTITVGPSSSAPANEKITRKAVISDIENGSDRGRYRWSQTAVDVTVVVPVGAETRAKDLIVEMDDVSMRLLRRVTSVTDQCDESDQVVIEENWWGHVEFVSMEDSVDWEVIDGCLRATLRKRSPLPGAVHWWGALFKGEPSIDVTKISGRRGVDALGAADVWDEAQKMFLEKVRQQKQKPAVVDVDVSG